MLPVIVRGIEQPHYLTLDAANDDNALSMFMFS